ncbi:TraR/DksA family transcriptional regulator [Pseudoclavibacter sp. 13-3]|uniref:TraR/DksA family transcriptional regulator n=1 Tax=Pseudoclavibacter sp. 13-3 TaxID=2901228 RepID=UPI001E5529AA|nr:TraR/DksA family transcriptional regulator [Pseudoclavibacter sp. 13-3]MCD7102197.1 TraR/DksA family transcriptional regulator [Pseudoclavibacter sp. 13-3]
MTSDAALAQLLDSLAAAQERERLAAAQLVEVRRLQACGEADDEHDPEGVPASFEWSKAAALLEAAQAERAAIEAAVRRARLGAYGICARCGRPIDPRRLAARPAATLCIDCAQRA